MLEQLNQIYLLFSGSVIGLLIEYKLWAIFGGAIFFAESFIITASALSVKGWWSPIDVFWLTLAGTLISDFFWYLLGQFLLKINYRLGEKDQSRMKKLALVINAVAGKKLFPVLLFMKFSYGTRFLILLYLSLRRVKLKDFLIFDTISTVIWLLVLIPLGWLAGKGINYFGLFQKIEYLFSAILVLILIYKGATFHIRKKITKKPAQNE
ncbi:MAG: VTT domain-containing protein [Patescibacteria group bacterium]